MQKRKKWELEMFAFESIKIQTCSAPKNDRLNLIFVCWQKNERSLQDGDCRTSYPGVSLVRGDQFSCDI